MKTDKKLQADVTDAIGWDTLPEPVSTRVGVTAGEGVINAFRHGGELDQLFL